jgi:hypothetical protein
VDITASEAMRAVSDNTPPGAGERARTLLRDMLAGGPMPKKAIEEMAKAENIATASLNRAKEKLRIKPRKDGDRWVWELPQDDHLRVG